MTSISKLIPKSILLLLLAISSTALAADSNNSEAGKITAALDLYAKATPMDVNAAERTKLLNQAESILTAVIEKNPKSLDAHRKLMGVYLQKRDYRRAIQTMQTAISLSPNDPKLYVALAILYDHQGAYEYAVPILDQALALDPKQKLAKEYKITIQQKIEKQRIAMESNTAPHKMPPHHSK